MKKRIITLLLIFITTTLVCSAANTATLTCEDVTVKQGEYFTVPVKLTDNPGIVAARIKVKYPDNIMKLTDISSGELTQEGLFNTTVTDYYSVKGDFDVVWSTTENVTDDGTFVMLTFKTSDLAPNGRYKIKLSYSQADTFNEGMEDVHLNCSPVTVTVNDGTWVFEEPETSPVTEQETENITQSVTANVTEGENENSTEKETENPSEDVTQSTTVSDDYFISSVDSVLNSYNITDINDVTDEQMQQDILNFVNNRLEAFSENVEMIGSFDELKEKYFDAIENEAVKDIVESTDGDEILTVYDDIKEENGAENLSDLPEEKKEKVVEKFAEKLTESNADLQNFNRLDIPKKLEVLGKVVEEVKEQEENSITIGAEPAPENNYKTIIIIVSAAVVLVGAITITVITVKRKKKVKGKKG